MSRKQELGISTLFVLETLGTGGSSTSLINLLTLLSHERDYPVDVLLFHKEGVFSKKEYVDFDVLPCDSVLWFLAMNKKQALKMRPIYSAMMIIVYQILAVLCRSRYNAKQKLYKWRARRYSGRYQNVIAYQEESVTEFCRYVHAENKIAWVHSNVETFPTLSFEGESVIREMYTSFDKIVCVSDVTKQQFCKRFFEFESKTQVIYNPFLVDQIISKSHEITVPKGSELLLVSIGRFVTQKRFDRIPEIAEMLKKDRIDFKWLIIGDGDEYEAVRQQIMDKELSEHLILIGRLLNPFPYIRAADYVVMTSDTEAHPMVANEALILGTPVISTPFPSIHEIVKAGENGLIASAATSESLYECMIQCFKDVTLRKRIQKGAGEFRYCNDKTLDAVMELLA